MFSFFAGLWPLVWHFGTAGLLVLGLLAASFFSPLFKKGFLWLALAVAVYLVGLTVGVRDEHARNVAQQDAVATAEATASERLRQSIERNIVPVPRERLRPHTKLDADDRS